MQTVATVIGVATLLSTFYTYNAVGILLATMLLILSSIILTVKFLYVMRSLIIRTDMIAPFFKSRDRTYKNWFKLACQSVVYLLQFIEFGSLLSLLAVSATFLSTLLFYYILVRCLFVTVLCIKLLLGFLQWLMMAFTTAIFTMILVEVYVFVISYSFTAFFTFFRETRKMLKSEKFLIIL